MLEALLKSIGYLQMWNRGDIPNHLSLVPSNLLYSLIDGSFSREPLRFPSKAKQTITYSTQRGSEIKRNNATTFNRRRIKKKRKRLLKLSPVVFQAMPSLSQTFFSLVFSANQRLKMNNLNFEKLKVLKMHCQSAGCRDIWRRKCTAKAYFNGFELHKRWNKTY